MNFFMHLSDEDSNNEEAWMLSPLMTKCRGHLMSWQILNTNEMKNAYDIAVHSLLHSNNGLIWVVSLLIITSVGMRVANQSRIFRNEAVIKWWSLSRYFAQQSNWSIGDVMRLAI
jgi:hypothetical protein